MFEIGLEPFYLLNKHGGVLLFLVIACLTLFPLALLYVMMATSSSLLVAFAGHSKSEAMAAAVQVLQICGQATLYFSLYFPFVMGLLSTHMSYRMVQEQIERRGTTPTGTTSSSANYGALSQYLQQYTMVSGYQFLATG